MNDDQASLGDDWPPQFELMLLQARKPDGGDWIDIFPAQLGWMAREGYDVRALSPTALVDENLEREWDQYPRSQD